MVKRAVFECPGDRHFVRSQPEGQVSIRELMAHNLVAWTPFLHCGAGRDMFQTLRLPASLDGWLD